MNENKIYIYAYTNHKDGLDRLRRMAVLYQELKKQDQAVEMLVNDFRAAGMARDLGVSSCTTIETIFDIDFVAERGDTLVLDSPEDDRGKLEIYTEMFSALYKVANGCDETSVYAERIIQINALVGDEYEDARSRTKDDRVLLFSGDSDSDKYLLKEADFFRPFGFDLLFGEYFYIDYESDLASVFPVIHESEEYSNLISSRQTIVTSSIQTAYEAYTAGANSIYLDCKGLDICIKEQMQETGISIVDMFDPKGLHNAIKNTSNQTIELSLKAEKLAYMIANK